MELRIKLLFHQSVSGSMVVDLPEKIFEDEEPVPEMTTFLTEEHISLYSVATGPGGSNS